ncbi:G1/S-specific cyclin-E-like isoform X1 [Amphibalanus amphitrite]|uniref:G1/S-specific cyclin-E-like isoform X1 n=2 Tax=Amphibalanus amphitrite TaxID=1232801 RepID=UPI001C9254E3|nr:G1/S-specific cyclin-E-like isoform X1 [Amphibalanus amphitrite]
MATTYLCEQSILFQWGSSRPIRAAPAILTRSKRRRPTDSPVSAMDQGAGPSAVSQLGQQSWGSSPALSVDSFSSTPAAGESLSSLAASTPGSMESLDSDSSRTFLRGFDSQWKRQRARTPPPSSWSKFREAQVMPPQIRQRVPPLPDLQWTEAEDLWNSMRTKDYSYKRDPALMSHHPALKPHMRAILIDWLIEVCEVHRLHRETFYLAVDFLDRYLSRARDLPKSQLQLGGITCLMIAAKLEEIYPPKVADFAYVTDGACTQEDIQDKELVIMKVLNWSLSPVTPQHWLGTYLQLTNMEETRCGDAVTAEEFTSPQFSALQFVQMCQLIDLAVMDMASIQFKYGVLAGAAFFHFTRNRELTIRISGYSWFELSPCVTWLGPFYVTLRDHLLCHVPPFDRVPDTDRHNIQIHAVNLQILEEAQKRSEEQEAQLCMSPQATAERPDFLTPPDSGGRHRP